MREGGAVPRETLVFDKVRGRICKATGRKIQIIRKEIQSQGKRNPSFFLPRIGPFQGLTGESRLRAASLTDSTPGGRRRRAWTCEDAAATPHHGPASQEPSHNPCPPRLRPRSRPFWGTKSNYSTDLENRKQESHGTVRLSAITRG